MNIKKYRKLSGYSVNEVAEVLGKSAPMIYLYEKNEYDPSINDFLTLATLFSVDPYTLAGVDRVQSDKISLYADLLLYLSKCSPKPPTNCIIQSDTLNEIESIVDRMAVLFKLLVASYDIKDASPGMKRQVEEVKAICDQQ